MGRQVAGCKLQVGALGWLVWDSFFELFFIRVTNVCPVRNSFLELFFFGVTKR